MTAADKYYLKAKDNYPYNYEEVVEAIEYGLSHDDSHPGLLTLQGRLYYADLKQFTLAKECFEFALYSDPYFVDTYYAYIDLSLHTDDLLKAEKLIAEAMSIKGIDKGYILHKQAILFEKKEQYDDAVRCISKAMLQCSKADCYTFYEEETKRIELKLKQYKQRSAPLNIILIK
ncbi:MAG: hypothetical protein JST82_13265 [Bacteroidetes bacterium]|nr:hypothetical protein [Bacteroidota bacterium]